MDIKSEYLKQIKIDINKAIIDNIKIIKSCFFIYTHPIDFNRDKNNKKNPKTI